MRERGYMNREIINVKLVEEDGTDYLVFYFADDDLFKLNLNSEESQNELKRLFCKLLSRLIENDLSLEFQENKEYSKKSRNNRLSPSKCRYLIQRTKWIIYNMLLKLSLLAVDTKATNLRT